MIILEKGNLYKKNDNDTKEIEECSIQLLDINRLNEVIELEHKVYEGLENKDILYVDSYDDIYYEIKNGGKIFGVLNSKDELIAYRYIAIPGKNKNNMGYDIGLAYNQLDKVIHLETTVVDPAYRGNGLQDITLKIATDLVKRQGYRHLLCTVSPYNFYSLYNIMKNGLKIKSLKKKYGTAEDGHDGTWRFVLHSDLEKKLSNPIDMVISKWANLGFQKELIDNGYIGFELSKETRQLNYMKFDDATIEITA
ncbi:MAG: hypothetical protein PHY91_00745 [Tissierellia bacterium]|nr:hypothetical protein [Tissierellia bacterium]MDD4725722.1 hypothetical protein [Tissierellia bacterium]